ncbi:pilus assembly protein PilY [Pseudomonas tohonis]|nr:pilus assembly protein PilY [Pseudomonas tohonis]
MKYPRSLNTLLASSLLSTMVLHSSITLADDTEIFFGGAAIDSGIRPNVLFILDDSGSMQGTRMAGLKSAFNTIISSAGSINVGVMALNTTSGGSRLLSPVRNINESLNVKLASPTLADSGDDATRQTTGTTVTNIVDPTLVMGYVKNADNSGTSLTSTVRSLGSTSTYSNENSTYYVRSDISCSAKIITSRSNCPAGAVLSINSSSGTSGNDGILLFRNLNVPKGVTISAARLYLKPTSSASIPRFSVKLENSKTPGAYNDNESVATRDFSVAALNNTNLQPTAASGEIALDITSQFQALQSSAPTTNPVSDATIRLRGATSTSYSYYLGDGDTNSPRLEITYSGSENNARTAGLRFQTVSIPQGARITSARIDFVPAGSDDRSVVFDVAAQDAGDASAFTTSEDFTGRSKTPAISWSPSEWRTASPSVHVAGPDVTALVQRVVNNTSWCGNNSMAFFFTPTSGNGNRVAQSVDANQNLQPVLNVSYTGGDSGCLNPIMDLSLLDPKDDARQYRQNSNNPQRMNLTESSQSLNGSNYASTYIAARFQKVPALSNAQVLDAKVIITPNSTEDAALKLRFEDSGNSAAFSSDVNNIGKRSLTSGGTTCSLTGLTAGLPVTCSGGTLAADLQSIFANSSWADGNSLSLVLTPNSSSNLSLRTYESSPANAIKLRVKLRSGGKGNNDYTIRNYTNDLVQSLAAGGGTPLVPTLSEAGSYLTQLSSKHSGPYDSPITSSCQATYMVLLTDGEANGYTTASQANIASMTGTACGGSTDSNDNDEKCGRTLVRWMGSADQSDFDGLNTVVTHTIGFNTSNNAQATRFLNNLASIGGGSAYQADDAGQLASAFNDIVQRALATNTTFVNATAPVNSFNRQDNKDELYFALFKPSATDRWTGNLKRYRLGEVNNVTAIVDLDDAAAIDPLTGFFKSNARSFWDTVRDGDDVTKGGAALQLPAPSSRKLFTYYGNSPSSAVALNGTAYHLKASNTNITNAMLGSGVNSTTERDAVFNFIRGLDTNGTTERKALGDPIHSAPRLVTYGCAEYTSGVCTRDDQSAILGTNEGFIQMFNTHTGEEQFGFMPEELLDNIKQLKDNAQSTSIKPKAYGMDNTVTLWVNDANGNGVIYGDPKATPPTTTSGTLNTDEFVYAYATMGRGGRNVYALDITDRTAPKLMWQIVGGTTAGFEKLSQTWSAPVKTKIKIGTVITDVLIFGGGYNPAQDNLNQGTDVRTADNVGNAIYIVNARTGALIWSASNSATTQSSTGSLTLSNMVYSIPSGVRVIDIQESNGALVLDPNQLADQFFVGDMGGQVWRFYINNGSSGNGLITAGGSNGSGVFASVGGTTAADARRFYHEPDVALLNVNGNRSLTVNIGSGYRGHPLNTFITDRFYSFRTSALFSPNPQTTLTESNLYDASANLVQQGTTAQKTAAATAFARTDGGWYITLRELGEKVLSRALVAGGYLYFNTYEPSASAAACSAAVGVNRSYKVRLLDGTPASVPANGSGTYADRFQTSNSGGISGDPQLVCQGNECHVLKDPSLPPDEVPSAPLGKTYWMDNTTFN